MSSIQHSLNEISSFEKFARQKSFVHSLHPAVKILCALLNIVLLVSFERHTVRAMLPFLFYPLVLAPLAGIPAGFLFTRSLIALPFCFFAGIGNVFFERAPAFIIGGIAVNNGAVSLVSLCLRSVLCVSSVVLLASTTPVGDISLQLRRFRVPAILVMLIEMTFRYIGVLFPEANRMHIAYHLRGGLHKSGHPGGKRKGVDIRHYGQFAGSFFLRTIDRSERIYAAMKCRGYSLSNRAVKVFRRFGKKDIVFMAALSLCLVLFRVFDLPLLLGAAAGSFLNFPFPVSLKGAIK